MFSKAMYNDFTTEITNYNDTKKRKGPSNVVIGYNTALIIKDIVDIGGSKLYEHAFNWIVECSNLKLGSGLKLKNKKLKKFKVTPKIKNKINKILNKI